MRSALLLHDPESKDKRLLAETKQLVTVRTKLGENIGLTKASIDKDMNIIVNRACGKAAAKGNTNKHQYLRPLLTNSELDIIAVPIRTNDKKRESRREHQLRLYIWGIEGSQLATNEHLKYSN